MKFFTNALFLTLASTAVSALALPVNSGYDTGLARRAPADYADLLRLHKGSKEDYEAAHGTGVDNMPPQVMSRVQAKNPTTGHVQDFKGASTGEADPEGHGEIEAMKAAKAAGYTEIQAAGKYGVNKAGHPGVPHNVNACSTCGSRLNDEGALHSDEATTRRLNEEMGTKTTRGNNGGSSGPPAPNPAGAAADRHAGIAPSSGGLRRRDADVEDLVRREIDAVLARYGY